MDNNQLTDMIEVYFASNKNRGAAVRLYSERFPHREVPDPRKFERLEVNLRRYGAFKKPKQEERQFNEDTELNVLLQVEESPETSVREISSNIGVSKRTVHEVLKKHKFKPYIPQKVHALEENDRGRREQFCNFYCNLARQDPVIHTKIIWSDECTFSINGIFNRNIHRHWSQENPRVIVETNFQRRFSLNVWCGILGNRLIGPFFIDGSLNQEKYYQLLTEHLQIFLDDLPLAELNGIYFQQDGATPHNARINTGWLNITFNNRWMGTHGPIRWPARSPDLTPLDFWLWGYIQDNVYLTRPENQEILRQRIIRVCREIPPNFIMNATYAVLRRCQMCLDYAGGQFEQYL